MKKIIKKISIYFLNVLLIFPLMITANQKEIFKYPVRWTKGIQLNSLSDISQILLYKEFGEVHYSHDQNQAAIAKTCNDYLMLTKKGFFPENNAEVANESFFKKNCDALVYLSHAHPAKYSFIRNFDLQKDYGLLPAILILPNMIEGPAGTVNEAYHDVRVQKRDKSSRTSIELISKSAGLSADISILAWGDFNQDGYDDMLIFVAVYATGGTFHYYSTYALTRTSKDGPITKI